jgi:DNA-binding NtrC family response regulator
MPVDVRVIASTEVNLEERTRTGSFRGDLFYLLDACRIQLPPLRERAEDIPLLMDRALDRLRLQLSRPLSVSPEARELLCRYAWPGNIAELESVMELASFNSDGQQIEVDHLPESLRSGETQVPERPAPTAVQTLRELEKRAIAEALLVAKGNLSKAARMLDVSRNTLYRKLKELELPTAGADGD